MPDKQRERAILRTVYRESEFTEVQRQRDERPDFVLTRGGCEPFGVEITEVHQSEALARLARHPTYARELFDGGRHIHREDVSALKVVAAQHVRDGRSLGTVPVIFAPKLTIGEYGQLLRSSIAQKAKKAAGYDSTLHHVNLLMYDVTSTLLGKPRLDAAAAVVKAISYDSIASAPFRELFVVTAVEENEWVFVPLKQHLLLAYAYAFDAIYSPRAADDTSMVEWLDTFAAFLAERRLKVYRHLGRHGEPAIAYGNTSVGVRRGEDVSVYDHADLPLPTDAREVVTGNRMSAQLHDEWERHLCEHDFVYGYLRECRGVTSCVAPRPNFTLKLLRPGFGPAAELPASAPA